MSSLRKGEIVPEGGMTFQEVLYRTTHLDGRIVDTEPKRRSNPFRFPLAMAAYFLPTGTKVERMTRTVTITATPFVAEEAHLVGDDPKDIHEVTSP